MLYIEHRMEYMEAKYTITNLLKILRETLQKNVKAYVAFETGEILLESWG